MATRATAAVMCATSCSTAICAVITCNIQQTHSLQNETIERLARYVRLSSDCQLASLRLSGQGAAESEAGVGASSSPRVGSTPAGRRGCRKVADGRRRSRGCTAVRRSRSGM